MIRLPPVHTRQAEGDRHWCVCDLAQVGIAVRSADPPLGPLPAMPQVPWGHAGWQSLAIPTSPPSGKGEGPFVRALPPIQCRIAIRAAWRSLVTRSSVAADSTVQSPVKSLWSQQACMLARFERQHLTQQLPLLQPRRLLTHASSGGDSCTASIVWTMLTPNPARLKGPCQQSRMASGSPPWEAASGPAAASPVHAAGPRTPGGLPPTGLRWRPGQPQRH